MSGRVIAFDVGTRRIGIALSDRTRTIASPFETLHRTHLEEDIEVLLDHINSQEAALIVVGWPLESSGRVGRTARKTQALVSIQNY